MTPGLEYPFGQRAPGPGESLEVLPGVHWLRMPLPSSLQHVNLWLLHDGGSWTIVDCGIAEAATTCLWERLFATTLRGKPVRRVLATHMHSDHLGLAHWLCERWHASLWMSAGDYRRAQEMRELTAERFGERIAAHLRRYGVADEAILAAARAEPSPYARLVPDLPSEYRRLADGDVLQACGQSWRAISGEGHTPEHLSFHCASLGVLIAGDMLLPTISPYVGVPPGAPEANPVPQFLRSIERFRALPEDTLVLPSHGSPFRGIVTRVDELSRHHRRRLAVIHEHCQEPRSAAELVPRVFRRTLQGRETLLALGEVIAHVNALEGEGRLQREERDGVLRFRAVA